MVSVYSSRSAGIANICCLPSAVRPAKIEAVRHFSARFEGGFCGCDCSVVCSSGLYRNISIRRNNQAAIGCQLDRRAVHGDSVEIIADTDLLIFCGCGGRCCGGFYLNAFVRECHDIALGADLDFRAAQRRRAQILIYGNLTGWIFFASTIPVMFLFLLYNTSIERPLS